MWRHMRAVARPGCHARRECAWLSWISPERRTARKGRLPVFDYSGATMSKRSAMLVNVLFRLAYGIGALLFPAKMATVRLAPDVEAQSEARLFVRGFGAHNVAVALLGLAGLHWRALQKPAAFAAVSIDLADMVSVIVEARDRGTMDRDLSGGLVFSAAGVATAGIAFLERE
jgi:hypothetical protein